jgi:rhodanese-related sulfurtransferase
MTMDARRRPGIERALAVVAVVGGLLAVIAGSPTRPTRGSVDVTELARIVEHEEDHVTAVELARWIRDNRPRLRVLDIRADSEFDDFHIPGATRVPLAEIARMPLDSAATYVLYSEGGTHAAQGWFLLRARGVKDVFFLRGGLYEWLEQVMNPHVAATTPQAQRDSIRALTLWFGGKMTVVDSVSTTTTPSVLDGELSAPHKPDARETIRKIRRRAC